MRSRTPSAFRGAGTLAFCAGADISEFRRVRHDRSTIAEYDRTIAAAEDALLTSPKPTIAMVRGICAGGGAAISLSCDPRFAARELRFSMPAAHRGDLPCVDGARLVPVARAVRRSTSRVGESYHGARGAETSSCGPPGPGLAGHRLRALAPGARPGEAEAAGPSTIL